jgi:hypothetical protein
MQLELGRPRTCIQRAWRQQLDNQAVWAYNLLYFLNQISFWEVLVLGSTRFGKYKIFRSVLVMSHFKFLVKQANGSPKSTYGNGSVKFRTLK